MKFSWNHLAASYNKYTREGFLDLAVVAHGIHGRRPSSRPIGWNSEEREIVRDFIGWTAWRDARFSFPVVPPGHLGGVIRPAPGCFFPGRPEEVQMSVQRKRILVLLTLVACIVVLSIVFLQSGKTGAYAAVSGGQTPHTRGGNCANTACNTFCWSDGTHHHNGTFAKQTTPTPTGCSGTGGCLTVACQ